MVDHRIKLINEASKSASLLDTVVALHTLSMEEMAELSRALSKAIRACSGDKTLMETPWLYNICEEIADVQICLERLIDHYDIKDSVFEFKNQKLERTLKRLNNLK